MILDTIVSMSPGCWASLVAQIVKNLSAMQETQVWSWVGKIPWRREWLVSTPVFLPGEFHVQRRLVGYKDLDMTERLTGEGNGTPFQYSCLENPMDRGAW